MFVLASQRKFTIRVEYMRRYGLLKNLFQVLVVVSLASLIIVLPVSSVAQTSLLPAEGHRIQRIAILPLENLTEEPSAADEVTRLLEKALRRRGYSLLDNRTMEKFLALNRIRYTGAITRLIARKMGYLFDLDAIIVGFVSLYHEGSKKKGAEIGVSLRMVSTIDGSIIWADTLSYVGSDFTGILRLGTITSIEDLAERLIRNLVNEIPFKYSPYGPATSPFELKSVVVSPQVTKSLNRVNTTVKVYNFLGEPVSANAVINGRRVSLVETREGFVGSMEAPGVEGVFPVKIVLSDAEGKIYTFEEASRLIVDNTPPKVFMDVDRTIFSSKKKGVVMFRPKLLDVDYLNEWHMEILDEKGIVVRSDRGFGRLPRALIWRGESDSFRFVREGKYRYRFTVIDKAGNRSVLTGDIRIKNSPTEIKLKDLKIGENVITFVFDYKPDDDMASWTIGLLDQKGEVLKRVAEKGVIPHKLDIPFDKVDNLKKMSFKVSVVDSVGNVFNIENSFASILSKQKSQKRRFSIEDF